MDPVLKVPSLAEKNRYFYSRLLLSSPKLFFLSSIFDQYFKYFCCQEKYFYLNTAPKYFYSTLMVLSTKNFTY